MNMNKLIKNILEEVLEDSSQDKKAALEAVCDGMYLSKMKSLKGVEENLSAEAVVNAFNILSKGYNRNTTKQQAQRIIKKIKRDKELDKDFSLQEKLSKEEEFNYVMENSRDSYTPSNTRIKYNNTGKAYVWFDQYGQEGEDYE